LPTDPANPDLLRPTLSAEDDVAAAHRPWNPMWFLYLSFLFGLPAGGGLAAINYQRFGRKERLFPTLLLALLGGVLIIGINAWGVVDKTGYFADPSGRSLLRLGTQGLAIALNFLLAREQFRLFGVYRHTGKEAGSLLIPGVVAAVLSFGFSFVVASLLLPVVRSLYGRP
jgi:hypothetical protein